MSEIGEKTQLIALLIASYALVMSVASVITERRELFLSARNALLVVFGLLSISLASLTYAFLTNDFSLAYVAENSSRSLELFYKFSAVWAGQSGSLLFWVWLLTLFTVILLYQNRRRNLDYLPYVVSVIALICIFFLALLNLITSPFGRIPFSPPDGLGLNPLLHNPGMVFHPLTLLIGYVGFTIPFSFAIVSLITGVVDDTWIRTTRRWTIFSWFFLGLGLLLGAQWAYVELGWGGYWAWDPVENAGLMPWLLGTAYLHSVIIQERRGMLKIWNLLLIILTFAFTIFGTFLTRSGVIQSVHSFSESSLGPIFITAMTLFLVFSFTLLLSRLERLKSRNVIESLLSRESSFLINNVLFLGLTFAILWGTIFPIISEAVRGVKITVSRPFFDTVSAPIGLALLLLTGICPLISWRKATAKNFRRNFFWPLIFAAVIGSLALPFLPEKNPMVITTIYISVFVLSAILIEVGKALWIRMSGVKRENLLLAGYNLFGSNKRRYGAYVVHIGVVMIFLALVGNAFKVESSVVLQKGQSARIGPYSLEFRGLAALPRKSFESVQADLAVFKEGRMLGSLRPAKRFYPGKEEPTTEVDIRSTPKEDLYTILAGWEGMEKASFKFIVNPLIFWLWVGGFVITFGTIIVMFPERYEKAAAGYR